MPGIFRACSLHPISLFAGYNAMQQYRCPKQPRILAMIGSELQP
jgi:hypothetical protein